MHFGERLQFLRDENHMTQQHLAENLNITVGMISSYERGVAYPTLEGLDKICRYFNVDPNYFLCYIRSPMPLKSNDENIYVIKFSKNIVIDNDLQEKLNHYAKFLSFEHEHNNEK